MLLLLFTVVSGPVTIVLMLCFNCSLCFLFCLFGLFAYFCCPVLVDLFVLLFFVSTRCYVKFVVLSDGSREACTSAPPYVL